MLKDLKEGQCGVWKCQCSVRYSMYTNFMRNLYIWAPCFRGHEVTMPMHGSGTVLGNLKPYVVLMLMGFAGRGARGKRSQLLSS